MSSRKFYLFVYLAASFAFSKCVDEEDEDYYTDEVNEKVSKLRLEGAEYLQKIMKQLQDERAQIQTLEVPNMDNVLYTQRVYDVEQDAVNYVTPVYNISGPTPVPEVDAEIVHKAPPISLTKEELLALYEAAITKGSQLLEIQGGSQPIEEHKQVSISSSGATDSQGVQPASQGQMGNPVSGYYYYYFPITSFLKPKAKPQTAVIASTTPAPQQLHATITMMESPNKSMEPLFMAISGFIGMALMFFFSVLFVPKFNKIRSKNAQFKDTPGEMANFAQIVLEAMAGKDCSERLACEIARVFKGIKTNNKPLRVLEIILPPNIAQQITLIRKSAGKAAKCPYIPCREKKPKPPLQKPQKPKLTPWKKKETPHDLWMKHFEKEKRQTKQKPQQQQQWQTKEQQKQRQTKQQQQHQWQTKEQQKQRQTKQQQQHQWQTKEQQKQRQTKQQQQHQWQTKEQQKQRQTKQQQQQQWQRKKQQQQRQSNKQPHRQTNDNPWKRKPPARET